MLKKIGEQNLLKQIMTFKFIVDFTLTGYGSGIRISNADLDLRK